MALLFFVSGYFTVLAWKRKTAAAFVRGRFVRLGIPTLLYMFGHRTAYSVLSFPYLGRWGIRASVAYPSPGRRVAF